MNLSRLFILVNFTLLSLLTVRTPATAAQPGDAAIKVHWLGLPHISADTNAAQFLKIWQRPETVALANQTLDKLARWPGGGVTNTASQSLRPLLDDLIADEFYVEVFTPTNSQPSTFSSQLLLALRLPSARAAFWQTNLATAFTTLTGQKPVVSKTGWRLAATRYGQVELTRADAWTILALGPASNERMPSFIASLPPAPGHASPAGNWLEADLDLPRLTDIRPVWLADLKLPVSGFKFQVAGEHGEILTRGTATLSQPWTAELPAWDIPTNLIHQPLTSFTAVRGFSQWLSGSPAWREFWPGTTPNQAFCWSKFQAGGPFATYFAAPWPEAAKQLAQLASNLVPKANPWLVTNAQGSLQWIANIPALIWNDAFLISPYLKTATANHRDYLLGGLAPINENDPSPMPGEIIHAIVKTPNLVYYQAEQAGPRVEDGLFINQLFRLVFHKPQLPAKAAGSLWLKNVEPLLGTSTTDLVRINPDTLVFTRLSTTGFSAFELHLLADWLESPQFPYGLHTFLAPPDQK
jgi:hypothetical protein